MSASGAGGTRAGVPAAGAAGAAAAAGGTAGDAGGDALGGYIDLHCHYLPGIDDGVRTHEDGVALCEGLRALGFSRVVATPHIRTAMFDNDPAGLRASLEAFTRKAGEREWMPALGLGAEHFFDDVFWERFARGDVVPYPSGRALLVELPPAIFPQRTAACFFEMRARGVRPVLAHPERYRPLARSSEALAPLLDAGAFAQLDLMSLVGRYGRTARRAAERMLDEDLYQLAASDAHRPSDLPDVAQALDALVDRVGPARAVALLRDGPRRLAPRDPPADG